MKKTALEDLLGIDVDKVNESRLYRSLDHLLPHKDEICKHLQDRYAEWFGSKFEVCIGLIVNAEGLPIGYEIFDGNRKDVTTPEEMVEMMEDKYGKAQRVWVLDRGFVSEENLDFLRERGVKYIVGTLRGLLKDFAEELDKRDWADVAGVVEVKIVRHPEFGEEKFILCRSEGRKEKEQRSALANELFSTEV